MNKQRREELLEVADYLQDAIDRLTEIRDEEQDAFDNMPEGFQNSVRGDSMQDAIGTMNDWETDIDNLRNKIEDYAAG